MLLYSKTETPRWSGRTVGFDVMCVCVYAFCATDVRIDAGTKLMVKRDVVTTTM